jgi:hypothetical protein
MKLIRENKKSTIFYMELCLISQRVKRCIFIIIKHLFTIIIYNYYKLYILSRTYIESYYTSLILYTQTEYKILRQSCLNYFPLF